MAGSDNRPPLFIIFKIETKNAVADVGLDLHIKSLMPYRLS